MDEEEQVRVSRYLDQHISLIGRRIYSLIQEAPLTKTDLRKKTSLPAKQLDDELSQLSSYNLIKAIKKPEKRNQNVWVLFHEKEEEQQEEQKYKNSDLIALITKKDSTISEIKKQAIRKAYSLDKFNEVLEMLVMRGEVSVDHNKVKVRTIQAIQMPCLNCELERLCTPEGLINPTICPYLLNW